MLQARPGGGDISADLSQKHGADRSRWVRLNRVPQKLWCRSAGPLKDIGLNLNQTNRLIGGVNVRISNAT